MFAISPTPPVVLPDTACNKFFITTIINPGTAPIDSPPKTATISEKSSFKNDGNIGSGTSINLKK